MNTQELGGELVDLNAAVDNLLFRVEALEGGSFFVHQGVLHANVGRGLYWWSDQKDSWVSYPYPGGNSDGTE